MLGMTSSFEVNEKGFVSGKIIAMKFHVLSRTIIVDGKSEIFVLPTSLQLSRCCSLAQRISVSQ